MPPPLPEADGGRDGGRVVPPPDGGLLDEVGLLWLLGRSRREASALSRLPSELLRRLRRTRTLRLPSLLEVKSGCVPHSAEFGPAICMPGTVTHREFLLVKFMSPSIDQMIVPL